MTLTVAQSLILATRPDRVGLMMDQKCCFKDSGDAFVNALENRLSPFGIPFGSFGVNCESSVFMFKENLKRLLQLAIFEKLTLCPMPDDLVLLPFSAAVHSLDYKINFPSVFQDFQGLDIVAKELSFEIHYDSMEFPTEFLVWQCGSVAAKSP